MCVLPVLDQSVTERSCSRITERIQLHSPSHPLFLSTVTSCPAQPYQLLSLYPLSLSLFPNFSPPPFSLSLSHCISSYYPPLSFPRFLLPLLLFSPPTSPCMERRLTASLLSSTVLLFSPSIFLSQVFQWLCKLSNLIADKVINTTLASLNIHRSALCIFLPLFCSAAPSDLRGVELLNNGSKIKGEMRTRVLRTDMQPGEQTSGVWTETKAFLFLQLIY